MKYSISRACTDRETQKDAAALLGKVFPDYWEQIAVQIQGFPFDEISFVAREEHGAMCGHVGVMPFAVSDGNGGRWQFAGIASVAVDPAFRGLGISSALCDAAALWAQENGFDALPLFTGKFGVYANHGWERYAVYPPQRFAPPAGQSASAMPIDATRLSAADKEKIIRFYEQGVDFPGKVFRTMDNAFHGWRRLFREPDFKFVLTDAGYALLWDNAVVEICTLPDAEMELLAALPVRPFTFALPEKHPAWPKLREMKWLTEAPPDDVYHGEGVMIRLIATSLPQNIYFPCGDKF